MHWTTVYPILTLPHYWQKSLEVYSHAVDSAMIRYQGFGQREKLIAMRMLRKRMEMARNCLHGVLMVSLKFQEVKSIYPEG